MPNNLIEMPVSNRYLHYEEKKLAETSMREHKSRLCLFQCLNIRIIGIVLK